MSSPRGAAPARGVVTPAMVRLLSTTRWCSIVLALAAWIGAALSVIVAVILFLVSFGRGEADIVPMTADMTEMSVIRAVAYVYLASALAMMIPAIHVTRHASALGRLRRSGGGNDAAEALFHERRLWKFQAITTLTFIGLTLITFVAMALKDL